MTSSLSRMVRPLAAASLAGCALLGAPVVSPAAEAPQPKPRPVLAAADPKPAAGPQQIGDWVLTCPTAPKANCVLMQQLTEALSRNVVFVWLLQYDDGGNLMSVFRTPSGVFIKPGLEIKMDSAEQNLRVDFERCDPGQCQAVFSIPATLLKQISAAKALSVSIALTSGQTVSVPLKMDGFSGAVAALDARTRQQ